MSNISDAARLRGDLIAVCAVRDTVGVCREMTIVRGGPGERRGSQPCHL